VDILPEAILTVIPMVAAMVIQEIQLALVPSKLIIQMGTTKAVTPKLSGVKRLKRHF
jgi:hypothetical protein